MRVLGVGLTAFDHIAEVERIPGPDEHEFMLGYSRQAGGIVGNALTAAARLGLDTAWVGKVGGAALADILFGRVNPSGKLPFTVPHSEKQLVPFNKWARRIKYGYFHGYTHFQKEKLEPRFSLGFGLSYTTYAYGNLKIAPEQIDENGVVTITTEITNKGEMAGEEIAQLYVGCKDSKVERPARALKGFQRVALNPGETKTVSFEVSARDFAYYDAAAGDWVVESGEYVIYVGASSRAEDLSLQGSLTIM